MNAALPINPFEHGPIRVIVQMEKEHPVPTAESTLNDRVKKVVAWLMISVGLFLLAGSFCLLGGHVAGLLVFEPATAQTLFICGLSAMLGGFTLQSSNYKGSVSMAPNGLPFSFKMEQK